MSQKVEGQSSGWKMQGVDFGGVSTRGQCQTGFSVPLEPLLEGYSEMEA